MADPSIKSVVLMPSAKAGEESVVQVESEGYNNCKVSFCIVLEGDKTTVNINLSVKVVTCHADAGGGTTISLWTF